MSSLNNRKGLSLTELLVASFLVGIVMLGMVGFNVAITTMEGTSQGAATGSVHAASASAALRRDIENAIGDLNNPGILTTSTPTVQIIAMRREAGDDPANYANDDWICWAIGTSTELRRRENAPYFMNPAIRANPPPPANANQCLGNDWATASIEFFSTDNSQFFNVVRDANNRILYIQITLTTRPDMTIPADPLSNPEATYRTRISPMMLSE